MVRHMFNQFEGNEKERQAKQEERLRLLKNLYGSGYFNEEGTEKAEIVADGSGPDDGCPTCGELSVAFIGGDCAKCNPIQSPRNTYTCYKCKGFGNAIRYGEIVGPCRAYGGVGHLSDTPKAIDMICARCDGFGQDVWGTSCVPCHGTGACPDLGAA